MNLSIKDVLLACAGASVKSGTHIDLGISAKGISSDTRKLRSQHAYIAFKGERFDGHRFIDYAKRNKAAFAIVNYGADCINHAHQDLPLILVPDTRKAYAQLALYWRKQYQKTLFAVVGSNGKTTTKEMLALILRVATRMGTVDRAVNYTQGNLNNDIGVPQTLLYLKPEAHQFSVVEIGMNHPGETDTLAAIALPTAGLITCAQREHQEFMHSVEQVAHEHASLIEHIAEGGTLIVPAADDYAGLWRARAQARGLQVLDFAVNSSLPAHVQVTAQAQADFSQSLQITTPQGSVDCALHIAGLHHAHNAAAAITAALSAGISLAHIAQGLSLFRPAKGRMVFSRLPSGAALIDDTYNANPDSMIAALQVLAQAQSQGNTTAVLGDMGEVGDQSVQYHQEIGQLAAQLGISQLITIGAAMQHAHAAYTAAGGQAAQHYDSVQACLVAHPVYAAQDTVLVKASRFMQLDVLVEHWLPTHSAEGQAE